MRKESGKRRWGKEIEEKKLKKRVREERKEKSAKTK